MSNASRLEMLRGGYNWKEWQSNELHVPSGVKRPLSIGWVFPRLKPRATTTAWL